MGDLISRAKLFNDLAHAQDKAEIFAIIQGEPTVDAAEVVHGEWSLDKKRKATCSNCGAAIECDSEMMFVLVKEYEHFCYSCGAKMDGGDKR